jgi:hypothetical protein
MRNAFLRYAALVAMVLALGLGVHSRAVSPAQAQTQAPAAGAPSPDILGIRPGMAPQQALDLLRAHDPGHNVALSQYTIPWLYGDKPITYGMNPTTTGINDRIWVELTLPPNPQVVWEIHRLIGVANRFTSTRENVLNSLYQKYGKPWSDNPAAPVNPHIGTLQWLFDEQGRPANPTTAADSIKMRNCMNTGMWVGDGPPTGNTELAAQSNSLVPGSRRTTVLQVPASVDPAKNNPACNNLIYIRAEINGGSIFDNEEKFMMEITVNDVTLQHRATIALAQAINAKVQQGAQQEQQKAQQAKPPAL